MTVTTEPRVTVTTEPRVTVTTEPRVTVTTEPRVTVTTEVVASPARRDRCALALPSLASVPLPSWQDHHNFGEVAALEFKISTTSGKL